MAFVQTLGTKSFNATITGFTIINSGSTVPAGHAIIVAIGAAQTLNVTGVTDSAGNSYQQLTAKGQTPCGNQIWGSITAFPLPNGGTITVSLGLIATGNAVAVEYLGVTSFGNTATNSTNVANSTPNVTVPISSGGNWVVFSATEQGIVSFSAGSAGTVRASSLVAQRGIGLGDNTSASAGNVSNSYTWGSNQIWAAGAVELISGIVHFADADIQADQSDSHFVDAWIQPGSHLADAYVAPENPLSHSVDAYILSASSPSHSADCFVSVSFTFESHSVDCYVYSTKRGLIEATLFVQTKTGGPLLVETRVGRTLPVETVVGLEPLVVPSKIGKTLPVQTRVGCTFLVE